LQVTGGDSQGIWDIVPTVDAGWSDAVLAQIFDGYMRILPRTLVTIVGGAPEAAQSTLTPNLTSLPDEICGFMSDVEEDFFLQDAGFSADQVDAGVQDD
jgi:hypothetical protein